MPEAWSNEDERQYEHIKESASKRGQSSKRAKEIAAATVNKKRAQEGRTKSKKKSAKSRGAGSRNRKSTVRKTTRGRAAKSS